MANYMHLPDFDSLPKVDGMPHGCAWGVFDTDGEKDRLGCLNLLTPEVVQSALSEARSGISISLNWSRSALKVPLYGRKGLTHHIIDYHAEFGIHTFDDEVAFNTQCSSQWDGLVHYAHQPSGKYYNGSKPTRQSLEADPSDKEREIVPTLDHWHARGGLVGRGVLLDYRAYAEAKGIEYSCFEPHVISVAVLEAVAEYQRTVFKHGDILLLRTGFVEDLEAASPEEKERMLGTNRVAGVEGNQKSAKWFWDRHFAAVASDNVGFEVMPPVVEGNHAAGSADLVLHQYFLAHFGMCIGELWDLRRLSVHCNKVKKFEFLLTSVPLNVPNAVGSPPNALAIF